MKVFPNPMENGETNLYFGGLFEKELYIKIIGPNGGLQQLKNVPGERMLKLSLVGQPYGIYIVQVFNKNNLVYKQKIFIPTYSKGEDQKKSDQK